ncbi:hypothetical protein [Brumimicrobium oceani]|uniref:Uncharacterized protein n=1 Tax=Brumimicrobium oceani TaxID=2100725 RepID=A0A2U2XAQ7_9FLAO|nr:hypothetical protein [Brumimicrobium oceani]PWH84791.1 hypothetical protein DIT68_12735 [Brumimicrobium oceani]
MKTSLLLAKMFFLSIFLLLFTFSACKKDNESLSETSGNPSSAKWDVEADLVYDDGSIVHFRSNLDSIDSYFHPKVSHGDSSSYFFIPAVFGARNLLIEGNITGTGNYTFAEWPENGDDGVLINLIGTNSNTGESEYYGNYDSYSGAATFKVVSFENNNLKGTFSGKIFQGPESDVIIIKNGRVDADLIE